MELGEKIASVINMADEEQRQLELKEKEAGDENKDEVMDSAPPLLAENVSMSANGKCKYVAIAAIGRCWFRL